MRNVGWKILPSDTGFAFSWGKVDIYILARQEKLKSGNFGVDDVASEQTTTSVGICVVRDTTLILLVRSERLELDRRYLLKPRGEKEKC